MHDSLADEKLEVGRAKDDSSIYNSLTYQSICFQGKTEVANLRQEASESTIAINRMGNIFKQRQEMEASVWPKTITSNSRLSYTFESDGRNGKCV